MKLFIELEVIILPLDNVLKQTAQKEQRNDQHSQALSLLMSLLNRQLLAAQAKVTELENALLDK